MFCREHGPRRNAGFDRSLAPHDSLLVCVPTTAGTAAEVSEMAVVSRAGSDLKLRYRSQAMTARLCLLASMLAGIAFNSTQLGLAHAIAAPLGALFHVPHGLANALVLPAVLAFNWPALGEKGDQIARLTGADDPVRGVVRLREAVGLDRGLDDFVPDDRGRAAIAATAMLSGNVPYNPRTPALDDVQRVVDASRRPLRGGLPTLAG